MLKIGFSMLIMIFIPSNKLFAQDSINDKNLFSIFLDDTFIVADDFFSFYTEPFRFTSKEWLCTAGLTGTVLLMISVDQNITNNVGRNTIKTVNNDFWDIPTFYGTIPFSAVLSSAAYFSGLISGNESIKTTGRLMGEALLISGSAVFIARYITGRVRPYYNEGAWKFYGFKVDREFQSFPSGHTNIAFALSTILAERIDNIWARVGFYGLAALTATAQVINNQHFLSDVVIGALFGFGTSMYVLNKENLRNNSNNGVSLTVLPAHNGFSLLIIF